MCRVQFISQDVTHFQTDHFKVERFSNRNLITFDLISEIVFVNLNPKLDSFVENGKVVLVLRKVE